MRLLFLTLLTVLAVIHYSSCASSKQFSPQGMLGRALLRRALEAMSNSPRNHVNRRSLDDEDESGEGIKHTDGVEDTFSGSGSRSEERGETSGERRNEVNEEQTVGSEGQSDVSETSAESSGDDESQTNEQAQNTKEDTVEASGQEEAENTEDQQDDGSAVSSGNDAVEAASDTQATSSANSSSESSPTDDAESGNEPVEEADSSNGKTSPPEDTVKGATSDDQTEQESHENVGEKEANTKKSTIAKPPPSSVAVKEDAETSGASSGESDEVTSDTETTSGESSGVEEDGSAEAIRKGMESLSKLLKPVANGLDFQLFSGAAKPDEDSEDEEEEEKTVSKAEGKGESDKAEDNEEEEKPKVVKVKKCETKCALPMTYDQCAVPRCGYKMGTIKDLCIYLCKHQKPVCKQECKEVD